MKHLLILPLLLLGIYTQAQQLNNIGFKRLYIGVSTTQGVGYRLLSNYNYVGYDDVGFYRNIEKRNKAEIPAYSCNVGFRLGVNITKFLSIETGIEYSKKGYTSIQDDYNLWFTDFFMSGQNYNMIKSADNGYKLKSIQHYIDIPLSINFSIERKRLKGKVALGAYANILIEGKVVTTYEHNGSKMRDVKQGPLYTNSSNISPFLSGGISYNISKTMELNVMPIVQFQALNNRSKMYSSMEYLYSGGINVALNFGFINVDTKPK